MCFLPPSRLPCQSHSHCRCWLEKCPVYLQKGRQWCPKRHLHGSLWGQPVHGSGRAVEGAAARALQRETRRVCSLSPSDPPQRHLPKLRKKLKGWHNLHRTKQQLCQGQDTECGAGACCPYVLGDSRGTSSVLAAVGWQEVPSASGTVQGIAAFAPPNQC